MTGVIAVTLLYIAAVNTVVAFAVVRDALRAVSYRNDAMKLWAGIWAARGTTRQPVFTRHRGQDQQTAEKHERGPEEIEDLSHDLMVAVQSDAAKRLATS